MAMGPIIPRWYLSIRLVVGIFDFITDFIFSVSLFETGHTYWGCLALTFPFLAALFASLSVMADKWIRGIESLSGKKFLVIMMTRLTELYEPYFESAPELILQTTIIWR